MSSSSLAPSLHPFSLGHLNNIEHQFCRCAPGRGAVSTAKTFQRDLTGVGIHCPAEAADNPTPVCERSTRLVQKAAVWFNHWAALLFLHCGLTTSEGDFPGRGRDPGLMATADVVYRRRLVNTAVWRLLWENWENNTDLMTSFKVQSNGGLLKWFRIFFFQIALMKSDFLQFTAR